MAGQAAEQIIAGVVLSERLAVTMYGAIHRAQFGGQRNLRGLVVDPKLLDEDAFRIALTDAKNIAKLTQLDHPSIVPTVAVESGGPDVVVVTRGGGRYVTVQDLIASAKARSKQGGKLAMPVAALIGKSVIEALAVAHRAGIVHGAVHPRSVLVDEDGGVRLSDFIVGRALTISVSQGADASLWRGLTGYIAPELVVGEDPTFNVDVFAVGAMMFTMLSGEAPPGNLHLTPAIERLVQRALDTDPARRYKNASDMLENLVEAIEDDRWALADRNELIREAGLSATDDNIDDATEDLLASLGKSGVTITSLRRDADAIGEKHRMPTGDKNRLDALIADLDDNTGSGLTFVDDDSLRDPDPISDIIRSDKRRVPSLDDPDEDTSTPPPPVKPEVLDRVRPRSADERAALAVLDDLDERKAKTAPPIPSRLPPRIVRPIVDEIHDDAPPVRLKSRWRTVITGLAVLALIAVAAYLVRAKYNEDEEKAEQVKRDRAKQEAEKDAFEAKLRAAQADSGAIEVSATGAGMWLRLGRTPFDTPIKLQANQAHDLVLLHAGFEPTEAQVNGGHWSGAKESLKAKLGVTLKPSKAKEAVLPLQPTTPVIGSTGVIGAGIVHVESTPNDAEAWLFLGANHAQFNELVAGRDYTVAVVKPGFKTQTVEFKADEWRDNDPNTPIDVAKKKALLSRTVELEPDPHAKLKKEK